MPEECNRPALSTEAAEGDRINTVPMAPRPIKEVIS